MSRFDRHPFLFIFWIYSVLMAAADVFSIAIGKTDVETSLLGHWVASWETVLINVVCAVVADLLADPVLDDEE